jgi:large subunit ribosomal protein L24
MAASKMKKIRPTIHIKRGDLVRVITGKDALANKEGKVLRVFRDDGRLIVEGANYMYKHLRKSQDHPKGGRIEKEAPIQISNVMLMCRSCERPTRIRIERNPDTGRAERICKRCGKAI